MSEIEMEMNALDKIIIGAVGLADEAIARRADLKQGRLASELFGRGTTALKTKLAYRLNKNKLIEMAAKEIDMKPAPKAIGSRKRKRAA